MAVHGTLERPRPRNRLIALLADGSTLDAAAQELGVTRQSVSEFAGRHLDEINERRAMIAELAKQEWIGNKQERLRKIASLYFMVEAAITEQGVKTAELKTVHPDGTQETVRWNGAALIQQARGLLRDAAEELGQIERPAQVHNTQINQFLIRQYEADVDSV